MLLADIWKSNRERCGGRFNLYFFWMYSIVIPFCLAWDFMEWLEKALTPTNPGGKHD
jgi:hypothetical protein